MNPWVKAGLEFFYSLLAGRTARPDVDGPAIGKALPIGRTGYSVMEERRENREKLLCICEAVVRDPEFRARDIDGDLEVETFCNKAFSRVCYEFKGISLFRGKRANRIHQMLLDSPYWTQEDDLERVHLHIERGGLAAASRQNEPNGHVVAGCPGPMIFSGGWGIRVPQVAHVGGLDKKGNSTNDIKGANYAFPEPPSWFLYRPDEI